MRVLILNWKDIRHPAVGGAEVLTHEVAEHWVKAGHDVTIFAAGFPNGEHECVINGVRVVRGGGSRSVYWHAYQFVRRYGERYDRIVDEVNTVPFFTPLYVPRSKRLTLIHQLAREVWFYELPAVVAWIGYLLEPIMLKLYRKERTVTVSESTRQDLLRLGFRPDAVRIIPEGIDTVPEERLEPKAGAASFLFAGRLTPMKRVDHMIEALRIVQQRVPHAALHIVGSGDERYVNQLKTQAAGLHGVIFHGRVPLAQKRSLMKAAGVIIGASVREGWGLFISEGAALGTPSVVYNVPGLRDSTVHGITGLVTRGCTPAELAAHMERLVTDPELYERVRHGAWEMARKLTWPRAAAAFAHYLADESWSSQSDYSLEEALE